MGKISEALEKASRDDRLKRMVNEKDLHDNGNVDPVAKKIPRPLVGLTSTVEKSPDVSFAHPVEPPLFEKHVKTPSSMATGSDGHPAVSKKTEAPSSPAPPKQTVYHKSDDDDKTSSQRDEPQKMERAGSIEPPAPTVSVRPYASLTDLKVTRRGDLNIKYSRTKVQAADPEKLKNNKIFSIFDDIETTDQIKILRTQVLKILEDIGGNSILVTSARPYEGKTFTSINLGVSIAKEFNRTVLIIDADLRKPTKGHTSFSTEFFSLDVKVGLTDYLKGEADIPDILINPGINKLTLIPSGKPVNNAPELLSSTLMEQMMEEIKNRYPSDRLVIVDGPAMLPFPDALILSRYVDGVLPVVEVEGTPADKLKKMMEILKETRVIGTVMNKIKG